MAYLSAHVRRANMAAISLRPTPLVTRGLSRGSSRAWSGTSETSEEGEGEVALPGAVPADLMYSGAI